MDTVILEEMAREDHRTLVAFLHQPEMGRGGFREAGPQLICDIFVFSPSKF